MLSRIWSLALAIALGVPLVTGGAQQVPPDRPKPISDSARAREASARAAFVLDSIRVVERALRAEIRSMTATKLDMPLRDVPQSVAVIHAGAIRDQAMQSMADVVRYAPGVTMGQGEGHRDAPTIRGNSSTADFFVDGIRDDAQYFRDLYNTERVEALGGPNAMIFGRGGGGGVINRVTKSAQWTPTRSLAVSGGSFDHARATIDMGGAVADPVAARLSGVYEHSSAFRNSVQLTRSGISPSLAYVTGARTTVRLAGEYFEDRRTVDRGLPSFQGRPAAARIATFFGDPDSSHSTARVTAGDVAVEHHANATTTLRSRTRLTVYDKFYQNVYPGSLDSSGTRVSLSAYNSAMDRVNVFNQTELTGRARSGFATHALVVGVELGRQATDNRRLTGYFNGTASSLNVPFDAPTVSAPVEFRASATDADNHVVANVASLYALDLITLSPRWHATLGARVDRFDLEFRNNRVTQTLRRRDNVVSPRAGLVFKPAPSLSLYSSYSVSFLPSAGDQFASLTATTEALEPERFVNYEAGIKWEPVIGFLLTGAAYQLDRTNTTAPDPSNPARLVQTGSQRSSGYELALNGRLTAAWQLVGSATLQRARITSRTAAAPVGATVPLVPGHAFSLWNRYQVTRGFGFGLGSVYQSDMFAAIDNSVTLPAFWRIDAAVYVAAYRGVTLQANVENLLNTRYYATAHNNNNITPGAPRTLRVTLLTHIGP